MTTHGIWLMKSEPSCYSIDDLKKQKTTSWDGVRNYQARNYMRDTMKLHDDVLFYHSNTDQIGIVGLAKVCKLAHPDITAWDPKSDHFDPKSTKENPIWMMVDVEFVQKFKRVITLQEIKMHEQLQHMLVARKGMRLSIQPVSPEHLAIIKEMGI